jgi:hypothetical protein
LDWLGRLLLPGQAKRALGVDSAPDPVVVCWEVDVFRREYYILVSSANGGAFARVGPYQSEDDAKKAASFSAIKRYRIEEQGGGLADPARR